MKRLLPFLSLLLASCVPNPFVQYYQGTPNARQWPAYVLTHGQPQIYTTNDFRRDGRALLRRGYVPVGQAFFNAPTNSFKRSQVEDQARKIGAAIVLVSSRYTNTVTGAMPLQVPQTTTSYSNGTATAYGPGGTVNAFGSGMTTTYGTRTMMMPYAINRSDFRAVFYAKVQTHVGIWPQPVDAATRQRLQTDAGIKVLTVVDGSPAFRANILPGDVVLTIAGEDVDSVRGYIHLLQKYVGQSVVFRIDRGGKTIEKKILIQPYKKLPTRK